MEFRNLTPFDVLCYSALDVADTEYKVVAMKVGYRLVADGPVGHYRAEVIADEPLPLCVEDTFFGVMNQSSESAESDLAPYKPRCDVILQGQAHAPAGRAVRQLPVRLQLRAADQPRPAPPQPQSFNPLMGLTALQRQQWEAACTWAHSHPIAGPVLLDKTLNVTGPRQFIRRSFIRRSLGMLVRVASLNLIQPNLWKLTAPQRFTTQPLRYEYAYGGQNRIEANDRRAAKRIKAKYRLTPAQRADHPEQEQPPVAHTVCDTNPVGIGFAQAWWLKAKRIKTLPAPQIEHPQHPMSAKLFWRALRGKLKPAQAQALQPQGFGLIGRPWLPRRTLAGTYDQQWLDERHPLLPADFDFGYWNAAPVDQQIAYPPPDAHIEVEHATPEGKLVTRLPGHRAFIITRFLNGVILPLPMRMDTLIIDGDALTLTITWRFHVPASAPIRVLEADFEIDPAAPLIKWQPATAAATQPELG
ncbi:DUF2169 family type VI secretion system accessory protein [Chitinolyticbacter albus]|uniref:DUF2169 family type VI secretion system accessory protein n=1 Tax=Chitinolyticbacter albus TaxID=2961951 RepID=UPI00210CA364|nr:DUF2169 domain-containing protein [Chitinolyticbacter albus]